MKVFGSRILRLAKYITESDADVEAVACADGSGSRAEEGMSVRLATIAVREALAKLSCRGYAKAEDTLFEDVGIGEILFGETTIIRPSRPAKFSSKRCGV